MSWLSVLLDFFARLVARLYADAKAREAEREAGAAQEAEAARKQAEAQEDTAKRAAEASEAEPDDADDGFMRKK